MIEGKLVCPESGREFPINNGIPNMILNEDEVWHNGSSFNVDTCFSVLLQQVVYIRGGGGVSVVKMCVNKDVCEHLDFNRLNGLMLLLVCTWCLRLFELRVMYVGVCNVLYCRVPFVCSCKKHYLLFCKFCWFHYHEWKHHLSLWLNKHQYIIKSQNAEVLFISSTVTLDVPFVKTRSPNTGVICCLL